ncbi:MAG: 2-C-methyl-D-erythritol 4-phosphate cytidylyltransferase [bacterium]
MKTTHAIIVAAGRSARFGNTQDKLWQPLNGLPVWLLSALVFERHPKIDGIILVVPTGTEDRWWAAAQDACLSKLRAVIAGGATRQESSRLGIEALSDDVDYVAIHDAARPLVSPDLIERLIDSVILHNAAIPSVSICDTLKTGAMNRPIDRTLDREGVFAVQTPQVFNTQLIRRAHQVASQDNFQSTDDASLIEHLAEPVFMIEGESTNFKITKPEDLVLAQAIASQTDMTPVTVQPSATPEIRMGIGYDIHPFAHGRRLVLGGVEIEYERGLDGHSDADVLTHAICDALLGAAGLSDIGHLFPNSDARYKDISSLILLQETGHHLQEVGWKVVNIDVSLIAEAPIIAPYSKKMCEAISLSLNLSPARINIKATTNEALGAIGRGEGIACFAVATIKRP